MEPENTQPAKAPNPLLDEVRAEREKLEKVRDEAKAQADRLEALRADQLLSSSAGQHIPAPVIDPQEEIKKGAMDFFKGSELEKAIKKHG
jgi:hypothetical protein